MIAEHAGLWAKQYSFESQDTSDKVDIKSLVAKFTEIHVCFLLETLYDDLDKCEKMLSDARLENSFERLLFSFNEHGRVCDKSPASRRLKDKFRIVGPLGERPLHVCVLRANNFPNLDGFEDGVIAGIKAFTDKAGAALKGEIDTPYGKDYCARIGHLIQVENVGRLPPLAIGSAEVKNDQADKPELQPELPYVNDITRWAHHITRRRAHRGEHDPTLLMTSGIYEGQTPLFMVLADSNIGMMKWLLDEANAR